MRRNFAICIWYCALLSTGSVHAQDWPVYGGDPGNSRYSNLKEINRSNVTQLKVAWVYHTGDISDGSKHCSAEHVRSDAANDRRRHVRNYAVFSPNRA
jgi:hypothetical protein